MVFDESKLQNGVHIKTLKAEPFNKKEFEGLVRSAKARLEDAPRRWHRPLPDAGANTLLRRIRRRRRAGWEERARPAWLRPVAVASGS